MSKVWYVESGAQPYASATFIFSDIIRYLSAKQILSWQRISSNFKPATFFSIIKCTSHQATNSQKAFYLWKHVLFHHPTREQWRSSLTNLFIMKLKIRRKETISPTSYEKIKKMNSLESYEIVELWETSVPLPPENQTKFMNRASDITICNYLNFFGWHYSPVLSWVNIFNGIKFPG